ncbi:MAG: FtsX-like permease family protein [Candidatus Thorarchaeota archaeon]
MKTQEAFPRSSRIRMKDRLSYIWQALISLKRNKRRSVSMIAGLILGISILSGISIYTNVLMSNVYESIIEGSPFEIRMDFEGKLTESEYLAMQEYFDSNELVADAQLLYGNGRLVSQATQFGSETYISSFLQAEITVEYNNETFSAGEGRIFNRSFFNNEIGRDIRDLLITGSDPGIYLEESPDYHGILISEDLSSRAKLQRGHRLNYLTLEVQVADPNAPGFPDVIQRRLVKSVTLENVSIAGVLAAESEASAGLFSSAFDFVEGGEGGLIYLPVELVLDANQSSFLQSAQDNELRFCALKVDMAHPEFSGLLGNPTGISARISQLINTFEGEDNRLIGTNTVAGKLEPFQIMSYFIFVFDAILTIPVAILSIYLLSFGLDISLQERRYQVGVLKTQGASPRQIKRKVIMEALILAFSGLIIGYMIAVFGAWIIGTASGFMRWSENAFDELASFTRLLTNIDAIAFYLVGGFVVLILLLMINGKSNKFIEMEVIETVRQVEDSKREGFLRRNNLDIIFFVTGLLVLILVILQNVRVSLDLGPVGPLLALIGPVLFWIGGSAVVSRLVVWIPTKTDPIIKRIGFLKDVSLLVKGNVFRKSGDIPRLALIISLTVSFAMLAAIQGTTGEIHKERLITYDIGADIAVTTNINFSTQTITKLLATSSDIEGAMAISSTAGLLRNDPILIHSVDSDAFDTVGIWQSDALLPGTSPTTLMEKLSENPEGCLIGSNALIEKDVQVGQTISLELLSYGRNDTLISFGFNPRNVTIVGTFHHAPAGIGPGDIIINHELLNDLMDFSVFVTLVSSFPGLRNQLPPFINNVFDSYTANPKELLATDYLLKLKPNSDADQIKTLLLQHDWVISVNTLVGEIRKSQELQQMDFGIPGLLTADFIISLIAATLATFIFMSILMEQRKKEFAILQSYGASRRQIYKVVFSETIVMLLTSVIWGLLIGLGLAILFNAFFEFIDIFVTPLSALFGGGTGLSRLLVFDWPSLVVTMLVTFFAMILATFLSVRGAMTSKISVVVREL